MFSYLIFLFAISRVLCQNLMLSEGSPCTWDGANGTCVNIHRCWGAALSIANKTHPPVCTFEHNTPVTCCTDCTLVNDTRLLLYSPGLGLLTKTGTSKAKDKCLDYIHKLNYRCKDEKSITKIISRLDPDKNCFHRVLGIPYGGYVAGGRNALREEFPHMALLGYGDTVDSASWLCGGTVISESFILTAAHCLFSRRVGSVKYIALGILKRSDPPELWQKYNVKRAIPHPGYASPSKYHDIALLETDNQITFSRAVLPACLHVDDKTDNDLYVTGWGALGNHRELADILQSVLVTKFEDEKCSEQYPPHRHLINGYDSSTQMCFGASNDSKVPTDTCGGDSGGPLQSGTHERCAMTILGVTSYGRECGMEGGSGIYTRVKYYVPWIEDIVWP